MPVSLARRQRPCPRPASCIKVLGHGARLWPLPRQLTLQVLPAAELNPMAPWPLQQSVRPWPRRLPPVLRREVSHWPGPKGRLSLFLQLHLLSSCPSAPDPLSSCPHGLQPPSPLSPRPGPLSPGTWSSVPRPHLLPQDLSAWLQSSFHATVALKLPFLWARAPSICHNPLLRVGPVSLPAVSCTICIPPASQLLKSIHSSSHSSKTAHLCRPTVCAMQAAEHRETRGHGDKQSNKRSLPGGSPCFML